MAITGIDTIDGKQIIAAGAQSAVKAAQDSNGNSITATYQSTAGMSDYQTTADMSNYATTGQVAEKLDASSTDNSNIHYNDNTLYVKAASSYDIDVLATGHMNGTIVYDEPFSLNIPHYFRSNYGGAGSTYGFSAFDENDVLLYTASSDSIGYRYKLTNYNMAYVGPNTGTARNSPIKYFSLSCSKTLYDSYVISAYKNISATGYSSADEFALAKNVIRTDVKSGYDVYFKDDTLYFESPYNTNIAINYASVSFLNSMYRAISYISTNTMGLGYSSAGHNFYLNADDYSGGRSIELKNIIRADSTGLYTNNMSANNYGFTANGISAGNNTYFCIKSPTESFSAGGGGGFTFTSVNTGFGSAVLTTAYGNQIVPTYSPKFEARNSVGAGFSIEASGARGYDASGNVTWDTTVTPAPNSLVGYADTKASTGDLNGNIVLTVVPKSYQGSLSAIPHTLIDANGITLSYGATASVPNTKITPDSIIAQTLTGNSAKAQFGLQANGVRYDNSAGTWTLIGSVQKREIEGDSATSAISAIAGSAISASVDLTPYQTTADMTGYLTTATFSATSALLDEDIQTVSAAIPVLSSLNTEGITDIQLVNELPVDPVSTVLYLIPAA